MICSKQICGCQESPLGKEKILDTVALVHTDWKWNITCPTSHSSLACAKNQISCVCARDFRSIMYWNNNNTNLPSWTHKCVWEFWFWNTKKWKGRDAKGFGTIRNQLNCHALGFQPNPGALTTLQLYFLYLLMSKCPMVQSECIFLPPVHSPCLLDRNRWLHVFFFFT